MTKQSIIKALENAGSSVPALDYEILKDVCRYDGIRLKDIKAVGGYSDGYTDYGLYAYIYAGHRTIKFYLG